MSPSAQNITLMTRARDLAINGRWTCSPNPMVGALVERDGRIAGEGYHHRIGESHAEVIAIGRAGELAGGATLYVTLEPCSTVGRTPPCTDAIIAAGLRRVVIGTIDPNPRHAGRGIAILKAAGIDVVVLNDSECEALNEKFNHYITTGTPFIHAKWAMTLDGKIATRTGESQWITGPGVREFTHKLRSEHDAIMVGIGTVLADNPKLNVRLDGDWRQPIKVVVDSTLKMPADASLLEDGVTIIACGRSADLDKMEILRHKGVEVIAVAEPDSDRVNLPALLRQLGAMNISGILVEGGAILLGSLLDQHLIHRVTACVAPKIIGGTKAPGPVGGLGVARIDEALQLRDISIEQFEDDIMLSGRVPRHDTADETSPSRFVQSANT